MYAIWSIEHDAWWASNERGYTRRLSEAGIYSDKDAARIVAQANVVSFNECMISLESLGDGRHLPAYQKNR